jgi:hypothetical protein
MNGGKAAKLPALSAPRITILPAPALLTDEPAADNGQRLVQDQFPALAFIEGTAPTPKVPVRHKSKIPPRLGASGLFSLQSLEAQPLRWHALDLFIERVDFLVASLGFRLAHIRFAQLVERFLDGKFFGVGHGAIPDANRWSTS